MGIIVVFDVRVARRGVTGASGGGVRMGSPFEHIIIVIVHLRRSLNRPSLSSSRSSPRRDDGRGRRMRRIRR